jgi:Predicted metalloprotease
MHNGQRFMMFASPLLAALACGTPALAAEPDPAATPLTTRAQTIENHTTATGPADGTENGAVTAATGPETPATTRTTTGTAAGTTAETAAEPATAKPAGAAPVEEPVEESGKEPGERPSTASPATDTAAADPSALRPTGTRTVPLDEEVLRDLGEDERNAVEVVGRFWAENWPRNFQGEYRPPTVRGRYDPADPPMCGDVRLEPGNAYYCPSGDYITWDADFARGDPSLEGNTFPYIVVAHEWGHAVQQRLGGIQEPLSRTELQADCLAGATLTGARDEGYLVWEPLDRERLTNALARIGDDLPEEHPGHHGYPEERVTAFEIGEDGVAACIAQP